MIISKNYGYSICIIMTMIFATPALIAQNANKSSAGSKEFGINGFINLIDKNNTGYLELTTGIFLVDNIELGLGLSLGKRQSGLQDHAQIFFEYNFPLVLGGFPFMGTSFKYAYPRESTSSETIRVLGLFTGWKFFIAENVAIALTIVYDLADRKVFGESMDNLRNQNLEALTGIRFYF